jgi:hypothetical protein
MNILEIRMNYTEEDICSYPGNNELRFKAFAPLFQNLHQGRVVYRERNFYVIASLSNLQLTPQGLAANAEIHRKIERYTPVEVRYPQKPWRFSCPWRDLRLVNLALNAPYIGFTIWPENSLVSKVERLVNAGDHDRAYALLYPEPDVAQNN